MRITPKVCTSVLSFILWLSFFKIPDFPPNPQLLFINPRRACAARATVVVSCVCVCLYVCLSAHAILAVQAIRSITKDTCVKRQICGNTKMAFFFKLSYSKVRACFTYLGRGGHL